MADGEKIPPYVTALLDTFLCGASLDFKNHHVPPSVLVRIYTAAHRKQVDGGSLPRTLRCKECGGSVLVGRKKLNHLLPADHEPVT